MTGTRDEARELSRVAIKHPSLFDSPQVRLIGRELRDSLAREEAERARAERAYAVAQEMNEKQFNAQAALAAERARAGNLEAALLVAADALQIAGDYIVAVADEVTTKRPDVQAQLEETFAKLVALCAEAKA